MAKWVLGYPALWGPETRGWARKDLIAERYERRRPRPADFE